ncbi:hypothetical protein JGH11_10790, partial [Dysgonomonas sp. Marseille-P4677]|nr:hypothetical protein [Dysgonomonas sp. Marseille-P4677]
MYQKIAIFLLIVVAVFFLSCNFRGNHADKILELAESLIQQNPDSVLHILEFQLHPNELEEDLFNRYILLYTQAKDQTNRDIANDTLVLKAKEYFVNKGDYRRAAFASFYSGHIFAARNDKKNAMLAYLDSEDYLKTEGDEALKGLVEYYIGDINYDQLLKDDAIGRYRKAAEHFKKANKYKNEIITYNKMGISFLMKKEVDSCFHYYNKGLALAKIQNDSLEIAYVMRNMGVAYSKIDDYNKASAYFRESVLYAPKDNDKAKLFLNMAYCFKNEQNKDSCLYYINKSLEALKGKEESSTKSIAYHLLSDIKEKDGSYKEALIHQKEYITEVKKKMEDINNQAILDVQKKYDFELMQNVNNRLFIEKQSALLII